MKRLLCTLALLLPMTAHADDYARQVAAGQLVDLLNSLSPFDTDMEKSSAVMLAPLLTGLPCPATAAPDVLDQLHKIINYDTLKPYLVKTYAESFDFNELAVIRSFYTTSTGARWLRMSPQMEMNLQQYTAKLLQDKMPDLKKALDAHSKDAACPMPATPEKPL